MSRRRFVTEVSTVGLDQCSYFRKVCFFLDKVCECTMSKRYNTNHGESEATRQRIGVELSWGLENL
jgi:hypothetical protein